MEAYELYVEQKPKAVRKGRFKKGNTPWNKGLSWDEQGWTNERKAKVISCLMEGRRKSGYKHTGEHFKHPVIQMDEDGNRLHWYESSEAAARKLGISGRNIRYVCDGKRPRCGGFRWCWDERFK